MPNRLVTVGTFQYAVQAETARLILGQEGIESFVADDNIITADWLLGNALGWIKLQVAEPDEAAARAVFEKFPNLTKPADPDAPAGPAVCLACGAAMPESADACAACGWSFLDGAEA